jgi:hypothetical protein
MEASGQLHAPAALPPEENLHSTYSIGGWVSPRAGLDVVELKIISCSYQESNFNSTIVQYLASKSIPSYFARGTALHFELLQIQTECFKANHTSQCIEPEITSSFPFRFTGYSLNRKAFETRSYGPY